MPDVGDNYSPNLFNSLNFPVDSLPSEDKKKLGLEKLLPPVGPMALRLTLYLRNKTMIGRTIVQLIAQTLYMKTTITFLRTTLVLKK